MTELVKWDELSVMISEAKDIDQLKEYSDKLEAIRILAKQGRITIPSIDGREVQVSPRSPLAQAQHLQDVADVTRFNEIIAGTFGPQMINVIVNQSETAKYIAEKMNLPEKLIRDESEQRRIVEQISQLQQSAEAPQEPGAPPNQPPEGM